MEPNCSNCIRSKKERRKLLCFGYHVQLPIQLKNIKTGKEFSPILVIRVSKHTICEKYICRTNKIVK